MKAFQLASFRLMGYISPFRFDRNGNGGGILLFIREDIPGKLIGSEILPFESFYVKLNLRGQKWLIICS